MHLPCIKNKDTGLRELKSLAVETGNKWGGGVQDVVNGIKETRLLKQRTKTI